MRRIASVEEGDNQLVGAKSDLASERPSNDLFSDLADLQDEGDGPELTSVGLKNGIDDRFLPCSRDAA